MRTFFRRAPRPAQPLLNPGPDPAFSFDMVTLVPQGATLAAAGLHSDSDLRIDGHFALDATVAGRVVIAAGATFRGRLCARDLVVHGTLEGEVIVANMTLLKPGSTVAGHIQTEHLSIEEGATSHATFVLGAEAPASSAPPASRLPELAVSGDGAGPLAAPQDPSLDRFW